VALASLKLKVPEYVLAARPDVSIEMVTVAPDVGRRFGIRVPPKVVSLQSAVNTPEHWPVRFTPAPMVDAPDAGAQYGAT
jgi:hypothetical protein